MQEAIRRECIGNDLFPALETRDLYDASPEVAQFCVRFCASAEHGLHASLFIWFTITLLDQQSVAVQIKCAAFLSESWLEGIDFTGDKVAHIYEGVFEDSIVGAHIRDLLYNLLDQAQEISVGDEPGAAGEQAWLKVQSQPGKASFDE